MFKSLSLVSMSKRSFWKVFWPAWNQAFSVKNISSGFLKTGIWPSNPSTILDKITLPVLEQDTATTCQEPKTPITCHAVRHFQKAYKQDPDPALLAKLFKANLHLASQNSIDQHISQGLVESLWDEKKRRKRGKHLNLVSKGENNTQFFSPSRIQEARDYQESKQAEEALRQQKIADKKVAAAEKRLQREKDKEERAQSAAVRRQLQAEAKAQKAAEKLVLQEAKKAAAELKKQQLASEKVLKTPKKALTLRKTQGQIVSGHTAALKDEIVITGVSRIRTSIRPKRYNI